MIIQGSLMARVAALAGGGAGTIGIMIVDQQGDDPGGGALALAISKLDGQSADD